jgi:hypothetical protein
MLRHNFLYFKKPFQITSAMDNAKNEQFLVAKSVEN